MSFFGNTDDDDALFDTGLDDGSISSDDDILGFLSSKAAQFASTFTASQTIDVTAIPTDTGVDVGGGVQSSSTSSAILVTTTQSESSTSAPAAAVSTTSSPLVVSTSSAVTSATLVASTTSASLASAASASATESSTTTSKSGVSRPAVAVTVVILLLAALAASFFFIRRRYIHKRLSRRVTWNVPVASPKLGNTRDIEYGRENQDHFDQIDIDEKNTPLTAPNPVSYQTYSPAVEMPPVILAPPPLHPTGFAPPRMPSPPPLIVSTYEDQPAPISIDSPSVGYGSGTALVAATPFSAAKAAQLGAGNDVVVVARTFIPTLPDELSIQTGEHVRVINRFDDGWCYVERMRSGGAEGGMVPQECLEAIPAMPAIPEAGLAQEAVEQWRLSKRKSSLAPAGPVRY